MKLSFLEYYKIILSKVSFDKQLMRREYHKAKVTLQPEELLELKRWLVCSGLIKSMVAVNVES